MKSVAILCGMPGERDVLSRAFAPYDNVQIFSGTDRLHLPALVPDTVRRLVDMGLCGGLGPPHRVGDIVCATTLRHRHGVLTRCRSSWMDRAVDAAARQGLAIAPVPWFSDGLFDQSNTIEQRAAIYNRYPEHPQAMSDETRFGEALALQRGIEFGVLRALSDDWTMTLPPAATGAILGTDGSPNIRYLIFSLAGDPKQIPALLDLERDYVTSIVALEAAALAVAPVLAAV